MWLERAVDHHDPNTVSMSWTPFFPVVKKTRNYRNKNVRICLLFTEKCLLWGEGYFFFSLEREGRYSEREAAELSSSQPRIT